MPDINGPSTASPSGSTLNIAIDCAPGPNVIPGCPTFPSTPIASTTPVALPDINGPVSSPSIVVEPDCVPGPSNILPCPTQFPPPLPNPTRPSVTPKPGLIPVQVPPTSTPKPGGGGGGPGNGSKPNPGQDDFPGGNPQQDTGDVSPPAVPLEGDNGDPTKTTARTTTPSVVVGPIRPALPVAMDLFLPPGTQIAQHPGSIGKALYRPTSPKLKAVPYEGFQYLEPCLLPAGTYIALETLPVVFNETDTYNGNIAGLDLFDIVNEIVQTELSQSVQREIGMGKLLHLSGRQRQQTPPVDLVPDSQSVHLLLSMRLPMGIFIPDTYLTTQAAADGGEEVDDADASYSTPTPAMMLFDIEKASKNAQQKIFRGIRRIVGRLKSLVRQLPLPLSYNTTFPGLKPYETIYVPHGLFVPLSAIPGRPGVNSTLPPEGVAALSIIVLGPGVFIPRGLVVAAPGSVPPLRPQPFSNAPEKEPLEASTEAPPPPPPPPPVTQKPRPTRPTKEPYEPVNLSLFLPPGTQIIHVPAEVNIRVEDEEENQEILL
ncbi:hypothetical protein BV898_06510 [Hypsibius exemplaris]|uniref:Uncharacterized protein n=1 Tax=Hypsibius exemplaris TaxID=2072580 RepID=A0A1W0WWG9_HYPEX|nr:hypothetical protein BV898_06510 [Hypsibius exemplaris]